MKKRFISMITVLMTVSFILTGCSLSKDESIESTEYLTDKAKSLRVPYGTRSFHISRTESSD